MTKRESIERGKALRESVPRFAIAAYMGNSDKFDKGIAKFASAYAKQNEADYRRFMEAYEADTLV